MANRSVLPIVHVPNTVLTTPAKTVTRFDNKLARLVEVMKATLVATRNPKGVGLAAPQIGEAYRLFVTRPSASSPVRVFVNATVIKAAEVEVVSQESGDEKKLEGCLSIPRIWGYVNRSPAITLHYQDENGNAHEEEFTGFLATIIQHETDHTNGLLFTKRVLDQHNTLYQAAKDKDGKEVLEEIELR